MAKGRQTVTYQMAVDHYGQPLFEKLKKKIQLSTSQLRAKHDREKAQKEIEEIDQEIQRTQTPGQKAELKVAREKIRQGLPPVTQEQKTLAIKIRSFFDMLREYRTSMKKNTEISLRKKAAP